MISRLDFGRAGNTLAQVFKNSMRGGGQALKIWIIRRTEKERRPGTLTSSIASPRTGRFVICFAAQRFELGLGLLCSARMFSLDMSRDRLFSSEPFVALRNGAEMLGFAVAFLPVSRERFLPAESGAALGAAAPLRQSHCFLRTAARRGLLGSVLLNCGTNVRGYFGRVWVANDLVGIGRDAALMCRWLPKLLSRIDGTKNALDEWSAPTHLIIA